MSLVGKWAGAKTSRLVKLEISERRAEQGKGQRRGSSKKGVPPEKLSS